MCVCVLLHLLGYESFIFSQIKEVREKGSRRRIAHIEEGDSLFLDGGLKGTGYIIPMYHRFKERLQQWLNESGILFHQVSLKHQHTLF